jgi:general secretion pathway protein L
MTTFYQPYLNQFRLWYADSPIREFLHWWASELKNLLPRDWQAALFRDKNRVLIVPQGNAAEDSVKIWQGRADQWQVLEAPDSHWEQVIQPLLSGDQSADTDIVYLLPPHRALLRTIQLPAAARDNLDNVLRYELDRYVPFNPDQVRFAWRLEKTGDKADNDSITVQVAVIPDSEFEKHLRLLKEKGIAVDAIDVAMDAGSPPQTAGINLLPREARRHKANARSQLNWVLAAVIILLLGLAMWNSLANKRTRLAAIQKQSKQLLSKARQAKQLQHQLKDAIVAANFIQQQKARLPGAVPVLAELTKRIPEDTYLQRVLMNRERIEISGLSDNANKLVPLLDKSSRWYSPEVKGAVQPDPRHPGKEKFTVYMSTRPPVEDNDAASS